MGDGGGDVALLQSVLYAPWRDGREPVACLAAVGGRASIGPRPALGRDRNSRARSRRKQQETKGYDAQAGLSQYDDFSLV